MNRQAALKRFYNEQARLEKIIHRERSAAAGRANKGRRHTEGRDEIADYLAREPVPRSYL